MDFPPLRVLIYYVNYDEVVIEYDTPSTKTLHQERLNWNRILGSVFCDCFQEELMFH